MTPMEIAIAQGKKTSELLRSLGYVDAATELDARNAAFLSELDALNAAVTEHLRRGFWARLLRRLKL